MGGFQEDEIELETVDNTNNIGARGLNAPPVRYTTWRQGWDKNIVFERVHTNFSTSASSIKSHWSVQWVARWVSRTAALDSSSSQVHETVGLATAARDVYLTALIGDGTRSESIEQACQWHTKWLESQVKKGWITLFRRVLSGVDPAGLQPTQEELSIAFTVLAASIEEFRRNDRALVQIVDELYNSNLLDETAEPEEESDYDRAPANQMVFAALGLISMLYSPELNPTPNFFHISNHQAQSLRTSGTAEHRRLTTNSKTFKTYKQSMDSKDENVAMLLRRFGTIIPRCQRPVFGGQLTPRPNSAPFAPDSRITTSLLNFGNLCNVVGIKIEWVDCLALHLEFDVPGKILKFFRFPSLCLLMCCGRDKSTFYPIFADSLDMSEPDSIDEAHECYREILLSYRLFFAQTKSSFEHFNRLSTTVWAPSLAEHADPLLSLLCGRSWEDEEAYTIYQEIGAEDASDRYSPTEDFPYLGKRLLILQEYVREHRPNTWRQLWHDQQDKWNWWMLWAFVILGIVAILLGIIQVILQILQLIYTIKPPNN